MSDDRESRPILRSKRVIKPVISPDELPLTKAMMAVEDAQERTTFYLENQTELLWEFNKRRMAEEKLRRKPKVEEEYELAHTPNTQYTISSQNPS